MRKKRRKELKHYFEDLEDALEITPQEIAEHTGIKKANLYATYRRSDKKEHYTALAYGTFLQKSGLSDSDIKKAIDFMKSTKS